MKIDKLMPVRVSHRTDATLFMDEQIPAHHLHMQNRLLNAAKYLGLCWLVGAACILIPVMHFFLVPLAAIAGIVIFFVKLSQTEARDTCTVTCPNCRKPVVLKATSFNWPIHETCTNCRYGFTITPV